MDLSGIHASQLNALTEPMADIRFGSLTLEHFHADITGDKRQASADVFMHYHDLTIAVSGRHGFLHKLRNRFGQSLAVREDNPSPTGKEKRAEQLHLVRSESKSFFNLIWKMLLKGAMEIALKNKVPFLQG
jgi:hypothetical protein